MNKDNRVLCFSTVLTAVFFMILILHTGELHVHKSFVIQCYFDLHISALFAMSEIFFNTALVYSLLYRSFSGEILCQVGLRTYKYLCFQLCPLMIFAIVQKIE